MEPYYKQYIIIINIKFINPKKTKLADIPNHQKKKH